MRLHRIPPVGGALMAVDLAQAIPAQQVPRAARDRLGDWRRDARRHHRCRLHYLSLQREYRRVQGIFLQFSQPAACPRWFGRVPADGRNGNAGAHNGFQQ